MKPVPAELAKNFCNLCNWAFVCWVAHRRMFDDNPNRELLNRIAPNFHEHIRCISHEYTYLQICKLHDRAKFGGGDRISYNLTLEYMTEQPDWGGDKESVKQLADKLEELYTRISPARNKVIAHNDLDTLLQGQLIGEFPGGLDKEYFHCLQEFASRVYRKWVHGHYCFKDMNHVMDGAYECLEVLRKLGSS